MFKNKFLLASAIVLCCYLIITILNWGPSHNNGADNPYDLSFENIIKEMFPDKEYEISEENRIRVYEENKEYYSDYSIEKIIYESFIEKNTNEYLVILRKLNTGHQEGLYKVILGVFDYNTNMLKSSVKEISSDQGDFGFFRSSDKTYVMFVGSTTYNGWEEYYGDLYDITSTQWKTIFPTEENFWESKKAIIGKDRLIMYKREIINKDTGGTIPDYKFMYYEEMIWDKNNITFKSVD